MSAPDYNEREQRIAAIRSLVLSGGADAARVLASALVRPDAGFQKEIAEAMAIIGAPALAVLRVVVEDPNPEVRRAAIVVLGRFPDRAVVGVLLPFLCDPDSGVRAATAETLGNLDDVQGIDPLGTMAESDPETICRQAADNALHRIGSSKVRPYLKLLGSEETIQRLKACETLVAQVKIGTLPASGGVPVFTELLDHGNPLMRCSGADILGAIGDPRGVGPLIRAMSDPDDDVRAAVAQALARLKSERTARLLIGNLSENRDATRLGWCPCFQDQVVVDTMEALVNQGSAAVLPLIELLGSNRRELRTAAVETLGRIRDRRASRPLTECLASPDAWMRAATARALGRHGDPDAAGALIACLQDPVALVRAAVAEALGELRVNDATPGLIAALGDGEVIVLIAAARALGRIGSPAGVSPLLEALEALDAALRVAVIEALADLRDPQVVPVLKRMVAPWPLSNEPAEVKAAARKALQLLQPRFR
jgi:HEAT repeat protein